MSTIQVINAKHPSSASNNLVLDNAGNATFAGTAAMASSFLRNRIINGQQQVDQRNAGASASVTSGAIAYITDRNAFFNGGPNPITAQRVAGAAGFQNALRVTGSASNLGVSWFQRIEANNTFDLAGVSVTFSAWVWASSARNVSPLISTPNSFENFSSQTVGGSATWAVTTTPTRFSWTFTMPANAVNGAEIAIQLGALLAADTVTLTGVQLEVGSVATPFERRLYGQELALCQRYAYAWGPGAQQVAVYSSGLYSDANQITMLPLGINVSGMRSLSATITAVGTQGTDWLVQTAGGVNQTGFTLGWSGGVLFVTKAGHGITNGNCNLQVVSSSGRIIVATEL